MRQVEWGQIEGWPTGPFQPSLLQRFVEQEGARWGP